MPPLVNSALRRDVNGPCVRRWALPLLTVLTLSYHGNVRIVFAQTSAKSSLTPGEFLETYRDALEALEREHNNLEAEAAVREVQGNATGVLRTVQLKIQCLADHERDSFQFVRDIVSEEGVAVRRGLPQRRVRSVAPQGVFELARGSPETQYQIQRIGQDDRSVLTANANQEIKPIFLCAFHPLFVSMRKFLDHPEVRIRSIDEVERAQGGQNVVVIFDLPQESFGVDEAEFEFAPDIGWRIERYRYTLEGKDDRKYPVRRVEWIADIEYHNVDDFIAPRSLRIRGTMYPWSEESEPYVGMEKEAEIIRFERKVIPHGRFLLSAFGLPDRLLTEPEPERRSRSSIVWLLVINAAVVLLLVVISRRRRRTHAQN